MKEFSRRSLLKAGAGQKCGHVGKNVGVADISAGKSLVSTVSGL